MCTSKILKGILLLLISGNLVGYSYKYFGKYVTDDFGQSGVLVLNKNYTFSLKVNLCQMYGTLEGTWSVKANKIILRTRKKDFSGFGQETNFRQIQLVLLDDNLGKKRLFYDDELFCFSTREGQILTQE